MKPKCTCVPSGRCHSHMLCGCPHSHYFDENNKWTCVLSKEDEKKRDEQQRKTPTTMSESELLSSLRQLNW